MHRKVFYWVGLALLALIAGGIILWYFSTSPSEASIGQMAGEEEIQSAIARRGDLILSISGTGELVPASEAELGFQDSGELVELNVNVGDQVQAGDVLARLQIDQTSIELSASIADAELEVLRARQTLERLYANSQLEAAQALLTVEENQLALEELQTSEVEKDLAWQEVLLAEKAAVEAEENLEILTSSPSQRSVDIAYASLIFKEKDLIELQDQITQLEYQYKSAPSKEAREMVYQKLLNLRAQHANQQLAYDNALYKYNTLDDPPEAVELTLAQAKVRTTQEELAAAQKYWEQVKDGPPTGELAMAVAQLTEAEDQWEGLQDGPDADEIAYAEAQLAKAMAELSLLQSKQLVLDLVAPMDGIVLSTSAGIGDRINSSPILTLADLSKPMVEVYLDETDLAYIHAGDRAEVTFDALPELTVQAQVMQVEPSLINLGGASAVRAWVNLEDQLDRLAGLPLGLNASVDIISGEALNAVLVPIDAMIKNLDGSYNVFVVNNGQVKSLPVQVGLMDATTAEIVAGLQGGEEVAIGTLKFDQE